MNFCIGGHANLLCIQDRLVGEKSHVFFRIIIITACCLVSSSVELFSVLSMAYLWPMFAVLWWLAQGAVSTSGLGFWSCLGWTDCAITVTVSWNMSGSRYNKLSVKLITKCPVEHNCLKYACCDGFFSLPDLSNLCFLADFLRSPCRAAAV